MGPMKVQHTTIAMVMIFLSSFLTAAAQNNSGKHIFILSGQSNMVGRGGVWYTSWDGVVPPECAPDSRILRFNAHLHWELAREPLHRDIDNKTCGIGPGMSFSNAVKSRVGLIGLVPCAVGGTPIKEWARGTRLYRRMVRRAKAAVHRGGGEIKALLWYQGESDTNTKEEVDLYKKNVENLFHSIRHDLKLPALPIIQVAIASGNKTYTEEIRSIQKGIHLPNVVTVDAKGLPVKKGDPLHLSTEAQVRLGRMLADAYLSHFLD